MSENLAMRYQLDSGARTMGLFCPVTSLPNGNYADATGVMGTMPALLDGMYKAGFSTLQLFPPNPGDDGDCPYNSLGGEAGDPRAIDMYPLARDGWISAEQLDGYSYLAQYIDVLGITTEGRGSMKILKQDLLKKAYIKFVNSAEPADKKLRAEFKVWCDQTEWLDDYAAFIAISSLSPKKMHWEEWRPSARDHTDSALRSARRTLPYKAERFTQWVFRKQAAEMKEYANERGIAIITDRPAYPRPDSADVWGHQNVFMLEKDDKGFRRTSGCPPDYFDPSGQKWGHYLPDWANPEAKEALLDMNAKQIKSLLDIGNIVRIDHARAIGSRWAWSGDTRADEVEGEELPGPGQEYFDFMRRRFGGSLPLFMEDLGSMPLGVRELLIGNATCMGVVQFAPWRSAEDFATSEHNPENSDNRIVYSSTHDNPTTRHWYERLSPEDRAHVSDRLQAPDLNPENVTRTILELVIKSRAPHVIATYGDILNLGAEGLLNIPGKTNAGFWRHRLGSVDELNTSLMTYDGPVRQSGRAAVLAHR